MDGMALNWSLQREGFGPRRRIGDRRLWPAVLTGVVLHAAVLVGLALMVEPRPAQPPTAAGVQMVFVPPAAAPSADLAPIGSQAIAPQPRTVFATLAPAAPVIVKRTTTEVAAAAPAPRLIRPDHSASAPLSARVPVPGLASSPSAAALPLGSAPTVPSADSQQALAGWQARVRQAVRDAALYPAAARLQRRQGRAEVEFALDQGVVSQAAVVQTSRVPVLDAAALAAVTRAAMPPPPAAIGRQKRVMLVWVHFGLTAEE